MQYIDEKVGTASSIYQVPPILIQAVIDVESGGNPQAIRYEPGYYRRYIEKLSWAEMPGYKPKTVSHATERMLRSCSLGLMQVMGGTARLNGFYKEWLTDLLIDQYLNVQLGTKLLARFLSATKHDLEKALLRYNGGGDKTYPQRVKQAMLKYE